MANTIDSDVEVLLEMHTRGLRLKNTTPEPTSDSAASTHDQLKGAPAKVVFGGTVEVRPVERNVSKMKRYDSRRETTTTDAQVVDQQGSGWMSGLCCVADPGGWTDAGRIVSVVPLPRPEHASRSMMDDDDHSSITWDGPPIDEGYTMDDSLAYSLYSNSIVSDWIA